MINSRRRRFHWLLLLSLFLSPLTACERNSSSRESFMRQKLIGAWVSEFNDQSNKGRVVTELAQDGSFRETETIFKLSGEVGRSLHAGDWSFDGTNFKRKYTSLEGRPLSNSQFGYTTYAVQEFGDDEFIGADNIRRLTVRFVRVSASAKP